MNSYRRPQIPLIRSLMDSGEPVCITLSSEEGKTSDLLFCELVHMARYGGSYIVESQLCRPGDYILGISATAPVDYYLGSGRYKDKLTAQKAVSSLPRLEKDFRSLRIEPLSRNKDHFDVLLLYLKPESAMRVIQAHAYHYGEGTGSMSIGAASICGDCTARAIKEGVGISYGCKGSRKHSGYATDELPTGISYGMLKIIEEGLRNIPATFD